MVVNGGGSRAPVVFVLHLDARAPGLPGARGRHGPDQPLYGIDHPPIDGPLPRDLADWVRFHLERLDQLQVGPPYGFERSQRVDR
jgi:hypothetical protein